MIRASIPKFRAIQSDGTLWAWGENDSGQLGYVSDNEERIQPGQVGNDTDWIQVSSGAASNHSLAVKENLTVWAWGDNQHGQLGDGSRDPRDTPIQVFSLKAPPTVPTLSIHHDGEEVLLQWPDTASNYELEVSPSYHGPWETVEPLHETQGDDITVRYLMSKDHSFFRLK